jgi:hypothetical protein
MNKVKLIALVICLLVVGVAITGCASLPYDASSEDRDAQLSVAATLADRQPTPTDINYSLERYNLIKRAYWVNGQREKANAYVCPVNRPLGYIVLFTNNGATVGRYIVDGKVSSLNSFLTPDSEYYELVYNGESSIYTNDWLADVDGSYGENDQGIFFFTTDGNYFEWTGTYLYTDVPVEVSDPILKTEAIG